MHATAASLPPVALQQHAAFHHPARGVQGVSALIKERIVAKATQPDNNDRLMLLFPEVRAGVG